MDDWRTRMEVDAYKRADLIRRAEQERLVQQARRNGQHRVPDGDNVAQIRRITWQGMLINLLLSGIKLALGLVAASQALVADAVHSLSDISTDLAVLVGVRFWSAPPDKDHPYGHQRIEALVTVAIGLSLAVVAIGIGYNALVSIGGEPGAQPGWLALVGALLSIVFKEALYRWTRSVGHRVKSSALLANAWHHRTDALSSIPVALAIAAAALNPAWIFLDYLGALVVSLFILHAAWGIISPALAELIDRGASEQAQAQIETIVGGVSGVASVHAIRTRRVGAGLFSDLHIVVDGQTTVENGHAISKTVEQTLLANGPDMLDVVVHIDPATNGVHKT